MLPLHIQCYSVQIERRNIIPIAPFFILRQCFVKAIFDCMRGNIKYFRKRIYLHMHSLLPKIFLQLQGQLSIFLIHKLGIILHFRVVCFQLGIAVIAHPAYTPQIERCRVNIVGRLFPLVRDCYSAIMRQLGFRHAGNRILQIGCTTFLAFANTLLTHPVSSGFSPTGWFITINGIIIRQVDFLQPCIVFSGISRFKNPLLTDKVSR